MKKIIITTTIAALVLTQQVFSQDCKTNADLDGMPGKFLTAAEYPWPAARAEYFNNLNTAADKAMAKQILNQVEKIEQQCHTGFNLTGGNWENVYSTDGYGYAGNTKLGKYMFQSALYEYFCAKGKSTRNSEYSSVLRIYINAIPVNTLNRFLNNPFSSPGDGLYDYLGLQDKNWQNHKPTVTAQSIDLFSYLSCNNKDLADAINNGDGYFQDVAEKDIRPDNRNNYIYRYWFVKKSNLPVLLPVNRKEYLQSLLEYYEREKTYFPKLIEKLTKDHDAGVKQYTTWETDVNDKMVAVKKALKEHDDKWLSAQAVINRVEDASQNYKAKLAEKTNYNRFWTFYDTENKGEQLYHYNPAYFKTQAANAAKPQIITVAFRYVSIPSSIRILNNFSKKFDFDAAQKLVE